MIPLLGQEEIASPFSPAVPSHAMPLLQVVRAVWQSRGCKLKCLSGAQQGQLRGKPQGGDSGDQVACIPSMTTARLEGRPRASKALDFLRPLETETFKM